MCPPAHAYPHFLPLERASGGLCGEMMPLVECMRKDRLQDCQRAAVAGLFRLLGICWPERLQISVFATGDGSGEVTTLGRAGNCCQGTGLNTTTTEGP